MRKYSVRSTKRKKHQRWFNQYCRYINRVMEEDTLWLGRFCVKQEGTEMHWFEDGSGGVMRAKITMRDKKTNLQETDYYTGFDMDWKLWLDLNNFIVNKCKVWSESPSVYENRIDYRGVK